MSEAALYVELVPTTKGIQRNVEKDLNGTFDTAEKKGTSVFSKIGGLAKGAAFAAAGAAAVIAGIAVKGGFSRMLNIEDAQAKLDGLGHSAKTIDTIMGSALASVKGTAFGLDTAATVAASAVAAGIKPGQELEKYLRLTADAATIAGTSMDDMGGIFNKVAATGRLTGDVVQTLQNRGIPILQFVAEQMGVTAAAAADMVSRGEVDFATYAAAMEANLGGSALKSGDTTRGAFANMLAALSRTGVALLENVFPYFKDTFNGITGLLDGLNERIGPISDAISAKLAPIADTFQTVFGSLSDTLAPVFATLLASALPVLAAVGDAFGGLFESIGPLLPELVSALAQFSPMIIVLQALGPVIGDLAGVLANVLADALAAIIPFAIQFISLIGGLLSQVLPLIIPLVQLLGTVLGEVLGAVLPVLTALLTPIMAIFQALVPIIVSVVAAIMPLVMTLVSALAPILTTVAELLGAVLTPILGLVATLITALAPLFVWLIQIALVPIQMAFAALIPIITGIVDAISSYLVPIIDTITTVLTGLITFLTGVFTGDWEMAWQGVQDIFNGIWQGLQDIAKGSINFIIDLVNGLIGGINGLAGMVSDATGGGIDLQIPTIPRLADGALIEATKGGGLFNIGEGRYDEMVVPLSPKNLDYLKGGGEGTGGNVYVYPQPGMSEEMIGRAAAKERNRLMRSQ
ncbi:MAG: tape measure protein [Mycetocola sp.]